MDEPRMKEIAMTRRIIGLIVTLALGLMAPLGADAQSPAKVLRIGVLLFSRPDALWPGGRGDPVSAVAHECESARKPYWRR
jgi:hypothetical protein